MYHRCSPASQQHWYNGIQESRVEDNVQNTTGDAVNKVSTNLPIYEDIKLFMDKDVNMKWQQRHNE